MLGGRVKRGGKDKEERVEERKVAEEAKEGEIEEDDAATRKGTTTTGLDIAPIGDSTKTQSTIHRGRMQPVCGATSARNNAAITAPIPSLATPQSYRAQPTCVSLFSSPCGSAVRRVAHSTRSGRCVFMYLYTRPGRRIKGNEGNKKYRRIR